MATVYIETTIPSFYYSTRKSVQALAWRGQTRVWWDECRQHFELCTSGIALNELLGGISSQSVLRIAMLKDLRRLEITLLVERVAAEYLRHRLMPSRKSLDAAHVAVASVHKVDYVLTWNCHHIANPNKSAHLQEINRRMGLRTPGLVTPYNLLPQDWKRWKA